MLEPLQIIEDSDSGITIKWSDDLESSYEASDLRRKCPCAGCVNEWTGERMLKPESIADNLEFSSIGVVGRYALSFNFSDGHDTGIYSFNYLRQIADNKN